MRISTNYIYSHSRIAMQQSISNLLKSQEQMATQRKINHLSDDPVGAGRILNLDRMIAQNEQFVRNLETASTRAELYDGAFGSTLDLLSRAKELLLSESNSATSTASTREAARVEIISLASQLTSVANGQYGDRFLFAGYADNQAPFIDMAAQAVPAAGNTGAGGVAMQTVHDPAGVTGDAYEIRFTDGPPMTYDVINTATGVTVSAGNTYNSGDPIRFDGITLQISGAVADGDVFEVTTIPAGTYVGDTGVIRLEVDQDVFEPINFVGDMVFRGVGLTGGRDLFGLFERVNQALRSNDQAEMDILLDEFDAAARQISSFQAQAGARQNLFAQSKDRLLDVRMKLEVTLSEVRDIDITQAVIELTRRENAYQAVLSAVSSTFQPTLLDFLR